MSAVAKMRIEAQVVSQDQKPARTFEDLLLRFGPFRGTLTPFFSVQDLLSLYKTDKAISQYALKTLHNISTIDLSGLQDIYMCLKVRSLTVVLDGLPKLKQLDAYNTGDRELVEIVLSKYIAQWKCLTLPGRWWGTVMDPYILAQLQGCRQLQCLDLNKWSFPNRDGEPTELVKLLLNNPQLQVLNLESCSPLGSLHRLTSNLPNLTALNIASRAAKHLQADDLRVLAQNCPKLTSLCVRLSKGDVAPQEVRPLLANFKQLTGLYLQLDNFDDESISAIFNSTLPVLHRLVLERPRISDASLEAIGKQSPNLTGFELQSCGLGTIVTQSGLINCLTSLAKVCQFIFSGRIPETYDAGTWRVRPEVEVNFSEV